MYRGEPMGSSVPLVLGRCNGLFFQGGVQPALLHLDTVLDNVAAGHMLPRIITTASQVCARRLIKGHGKNSSLRVWPLDSIAFSDRSDACRNISQARLLRCPSLPWSCHPQNLSAVLNAAARCECAWRVQQALDPLHCCSACV